MVGGEVEGVNSTNTRHSGLVVTTTASHHTPDNETAVQSLKPSQIIRTGGAGYKAALVMENKADVYVYNAGGCKLWDICAPHAIIKALGGDITTVCGSQIEYTLPHLNVPSLVASLRNHDEHISTIAKRKQ